VAQFESSGEKRDFMQVARDVVEQAIGVENHAAAVALWFMYYNFCRVHQTLRVTPAMEVGLTDHVWTIAELLT
jgi:hypothetical protein